MNLAHFRKLLPKLILLTKIQKKTPTTVVFKESFWPEIEIFQPKLLNFFLNYTARDSVTHPSESSLVQCVKLAHGCHGKRHLPEPPAGKERRRQQSTSFSQAPL